MEDLMQVAKKIKDLEIQGARNVAKAAICSIKDLILNSSASKPDLLFKELLQAKDILFGTRPTEPAMRNGIRSVLYQVKEAKADISATKEIAIKACDQVLNYFEDATWKIHEIGARKIVSGMQIMTHCHSSTVTGILRKAHDQGKDIHVICTETRPRFQGHRTARELVKAGIEVTFVVDSAMRYMMKHLEVDIALIGADAITSEGTIINKIGTRLFALAADERDVPFYCAADTFKFSPETSLGFLENIEKRDPEEIWKDAPSGLHIENPAFETVPRRYIDGLITEVGVFPPSSIAHQLFQLHPWMFTFEE
ncbi:MAG: translation initiation factor eIF-2B [Promethearchaeota archaeon]